MNGTTDWSRCPSYLFVSFVIEPFQKHPCKSVSMRAEGAASDRGSGCHYSLMIDNAVNNFEIDLMGLLFFFNGFVRTDYTTIITLFKSSDSWDNLEKNFCSPRFELTLSPS